MGDIDEAMNQATVGHQLHPKDPQFLLLDSRLKLVDGKLLKSIIEPTI